MRLSTLYADRDISTVYDQRVHNPEEQTAWNELYNAAIASPDPLQFIATHLSNAFKYEREGMPHLGTRELAQIWHDAHKVPPPESLERITSPTGAI